MRRIRHLSLLAALGLAAAVSGPLAAQNPAAPNPRAPAAPAVDTTVAAAPDTLRYSARGALVRSLVLPGWGQAYVGAPARGAIYFGLEAGSLWMVLKSRRELAAARRLEAALRDQNPNASPTELPLARARRQQVEDWVTLSIFLLFFSGADAYVAAQLSDFAQHVGVLPEEGGVMRLQVNLPVGHTR